MSYKNYLKIILFFCIGLLNATYISAQSIVINEFMASNATTIEDDFGDFDDWVELYNTGTASVDVGGLYLTDDLTELDQWQIPTTDPAVTTIPAGGFLIIWLDKESVQGILHAEIKLSSNGEDIALVASNGTTVIDSYTFGPQTQDVSEGRVGDGNPVFDFFADPTPGESNNTTSGMTMVDDVIASVGGGIYNTVQTVQLSTTTVGADIYYTLDGSVPTMSDVLYTNAITVDAMTTLRARAFSAPLTPSNTMTHTYLWNVNHTFAIISLTGDPDEFFDPVTGMYSEGPDPNNPNFLQDIELNVNVEMFEPDGSLGFNQIMEVEVSGSGSAYYAQKSLSAKAKSSLGSDVIDYSIFPDLAFDQYRSLVFRNSGQDNNLNQFRDGMVSSLVRDLTDIDPIIKEPKLYTQGFRPGVVYINGEYWGIQNIRERTDKRYLKVHFGLEDTEIDFIDEGGLNIDVKEGTEDDWLDLQDFLASNNFADQANFDELATRVDLDAYLDYIVFNVFIDNADWPGNNNRRWREISETNGQWRWMVKDLDFTFGLFDPNGVHGWNSGYAGNNSLYRLMNPDNTTTRNPEWSVRLFNSLLENEGWRNDFINRMADQSNVLFNPSRVIARIDEFEAIYDDNNAIESEKDKHFLRWWDPPSTNPGWGNNPQILRNFSNDRLPFLYDHFVSGFNSVTGTDEVTLDANPQDKGSIEFSTITLGEAQYPWTGTYFMGIDIPIKAVPVPGYVLTSWSGDLTGSDANTTVNISGVSSITANFGLGSTSTDPIVINEINYNSPDDAESGDWVELYNPNTNAVDISGWYFQDEGGSYFPIPGNTIIPAGGYLLLIENESEFLSIYPAVTNYIGEFGEGAIGFGLSGGGELITLKNANGTLIDEVDYDDKSPWPTGPDGDGPTLQLLDPALDNALAASWKGDVATPGVINDGTALQNQIITFPAIGDKLTTSSPFNLNATASSGLAVSYEIITGPATVSGNTVTLTGQVGTVTVRASQAGNASFNPAQDVEQSFQVINDGPVTYCTSQGITPWQEWISNVSFEEIDNNSVKTSYSDFTSQSANVNLGETHDISLTVSFGSPAANEFWRVWIDYNHDGVFQEPGEIAFSQMITTTGASVTTTGAISIPATAILGSTRMRVSMKGGAFAGPCESFSLGEVEDYTVIINDGSSSSTCDNNVQDGDETGIDCGGSCPDACPDTPCQINLNPSMFFFADGASASASGDAGSLADEQGEMGDPINGAGQPISIVDVPWITPWSANQVAYVDLGQDYDISSMHLFDGAGSGQFTVAPGLPSDNNPAIIDFNTDSYGAWVDFDNLQITSTRYLTFTKVSGGSRINEIAICGFPTGSTPVPSCTDNIQNGDETDIDCGGSCPNDCPIGVCEITINVCGVDLVFDGLEVTFGSGSASPGGVLNIQFYQVGPGGWTGPYQLCNDWTTDNPCVTGESLLLPSAGNYAILVGGVDGCNAFYYNVLTCANQNGESPENEVAPIQIDQLYPNPVNDELIVALNSKDLVNAQIRIMNAQGQIVLNSPELIQTGLNKLFFNVQDFPKGIYYLYIDGVEGKKEAFKFIKM